MKLRIISYEEDENRARCIKDIREVPFNQKTASGRCRAIGRHIDEALSFGSSRIVVDIIKSDS